MGMTGNVFRRRNGGDWEANKSEQSSARTNEPRDQCLGAKTDAVRPHRYCEQAKHSRIEDARRGLEIM